MICRDYKDGYLLITQLSHSEGCGELVKFWGNDSFLSPNPLDDMVTATRLHDIGWAKLDGDPILNADGTPKNFLQSSIDESEGIWKRALDTMRSYNPYVAILVSMHASNLFKLRLKRTENPEEREQVQALIDEHLEQQNKLRMFLINTGLYANFTDKETLKANYRILRACDLLSLACCTQRLSSGTIENAPSVDEDETITIRYTPADEKTLVLYPYPFKEPEVILEVSGRYVPQKTFESQEAYHTALENAETHTLTFYFREEV